MSNALAMFVSLADDPLQHAANGFWRLAAGLSPYGLCAPQSAKELDEMSVTFGCAAKTMVVPAGNFAAFVGDILVVDEGRGCALAGLYLVHWEGGRFVVRQIPIATAELEHVTFAPIDIPALP